MRKVSFIPLLAFLGGALFLHAQDYSPGNKISGGSGKTENPAGPEMVWLGIEYSGPYTQIERSDWSRYDNGKYTGHVYREVRASMNPMVGQISAEGPGLFYQGNFFVMEETLRDMRQSARAVDMIRPVKFQVHKNGTMTIEDDQGFPTLRGFPSFPASAIKAGSKWTAPASRALDPLYQGNPVIVPFTAEYEYRGIENYRDIPVHRITAKYSTRYQGRPAQTKTRLGAEGLNGSQAEGFSVQGSHSVDILLRVSDGLLLLMRDNLDETVSFFDGSTLRFRGFTLTFGQGIMPINQPGTIVALEKSLGIEKKPLEKTPPGDAPNLVPAPRLDPGPDIEVSSVPEGIRLRVNNIRFAADSDVFLPEEKSRLDKIAQALTQIPDRMILVEGHTASTGRLAGEMELSVQRAKRMIGELVSRGIRVDRFIYKGWGGEKPVADNATEEGRGLNRRVEITILD